MKRIWLPFSILVLVLFLLPFPQDHQDGAYNLTSHLAWCRTRAACLHEIGHALDQQAGWVSQSFEFHNTLQMYLFVEIYQQGITQLPADILEITYRGTGSSGPIKRELYAYLFQYAQGDPAHMPEAFRKFYDWDLARDYLQHLKPEQMLYWMN
jgi:hypothetical protein